MTQCVATFTHGVGCDLDAGVSVSVEEVVDSVVEEIEGDRVIVLVSKCGCIKIEEVTQ